MNEPKGSRPRLLVLTSTLPRWLGDSEPRFVLDLAKAMTDHFDPLILAPMAAGTAKYELLEGVPVKRFAYAPIDGWQTLAAPGAIMPNLRKRPLLHALVPIFLLAQLVALIRLLRREPFDVVHCHWLIPQGLILSIAALFVRVPPILVTCHGADAFTLEYPPFFQLKRWSLRCADAVTVVSGEISRHFGNMGNRPLQHIPMGVDLGRFKQRDIVPQAVPTLLFVGRLAAKKGLDRLIQAMADPRLVRRGVCLRIVGDGPLRREFDRLSIKLGLTTRITFVGSLPHDQVALEMSKADLFCAPFVVSDDGDREGTPTVLLEAAACGIPVITSDVGGCSDIIASGESGWLLPPGNVTALADAMIEALENPDRTEEMAVRARQRAADYAWPRIAGRYAKILDQIHASGRQVA